VLFPRANDRPDSPGLLAALRRMAPHLGSRAMARSGSVRSFEQTVEQSVREPDKSIDPMMREAADRGRDDGRYIRGATPAGSHRDGKPDATALLGPGLLAANDPGAADRLAQATGQTPDLASA
jgi:hypothetical protein